MICVKYKIISIGNQWVILRVENGDSEAVGKIIPKTNNSIIILFETQKINLTSRFVGENIFFSMKAEELILRSNLRTTQKQSLVWKQENKLNDFYKCIKHKDLYYLKQSNQTLAKLKEISNKYYLLELNQSTKLSYAVILACFFPLLN